MPRAVSHLSYFILNPPFFIMSSRSIFSHRWLTRLFSAIIAVAFVACTPGDLLDVLLDDEEKTEYTISVSPNGTVSFPAEGGSVEFRVTTNGKRYGRKFDANWLTATFDKSKSYNSIVFTAEANGTGQERSVVVTFYAQEEEDGKYVAEEKVTLVQPAESGELATTKLSGTVDFGGSVDASTCTVMTMLDEQPVSAGSSFTANAFDSRSLPQPLLVCNSKGDVVMMSRAPYASGDRPEINAHTTALALATMFPLFAPVKGADEFKTMTAMFTKASKWTAFESEVTKLVRANKPIWSANNTSMINALDALFDEICVPRSVYPLTRADQPQVYGGDAERPFKMEISGHKVKFFSYSLTPMYEGKLFNTLEMNEPVATLDIPAGNDYGVTDLALRWGQFTWAEAATFDFDTLPESAGEGEFLFHFSRMTSRAQTDFVVNLFCNMLDIIGAGVGSIGTATLKRAVQKYIVQRGAALTQLIMSGKWTKMELAEAFYAAILDFFSSKEFVELCGIAAGSAGLAVVKKLSPITTVYCIIRGSGNTLLRTHFRLSMPETVDFPICFKVAFPLSTCEYVKLEVVSGNNQQGHSGEYLEDPIRIRVNTDGITYPASSYYLRFSVDDGSGGEPLDEQVFTVDLEGETFWRLGTKERVQHLMVDAIDFATGAIVSETSLILQAIATDLTEVEKKSIPDRFQGKWVQKPGTYTGSPIKMDIHKYKASYHDPQNAYLDFNSLDVWYAPDVTTDAGLYDVIYFDEFDPTTNYYEEFLRGVRGGDTELYVSDGYGPAGYCVFVPDDGASVSPSEMTFDADGGTQNAKVTATGYKKFGISVDNSYSDWLSAKTSSGGNIAVTAKPNIDASKRIGYVKWWVSKSDTPTDADKEWGSPIRVTQEPGNGNDITVSGGSLKMTLKLQEQMDNNGGSINIERSITCNSLDFLQQSGTSVSISGSQSTNTDRQSFSCTITGITGDCSSTKATGASYGRTYQASNGNSYGDASVSFADLSLVSKSVGSTSARFVYRGSGSNLVTSFSKSGTDSYGVEHIYRCLSDASNQIEVEVNLKITKTRALAPPSRRNELPAQAWSSSGMDDL